MLPHEASGVCVTLRSAAVSLGPRLGAARCRVTRVTARRLASATRSQKVRGFAGNPQGVQTRLLQSRAPRPASFLKAGTARHETSLSLRHQWGKTATLPMSVPPPGARPHTWSQSRRGGRGIRHSPQAARRIGPGAGEGTHGGGGVSLQASAEPRGCVGGGGVCDMFSQSLQGAGGGGDVPFGAAQHPAAGFPGAVPRGVPAWRPPCGHHASFVRPSDPPG